MEWQNEMDINLYDFGARNYDPALGRWMNVDPLAEKYPSISPYTYAYNNPVYYIDPDRMMSWGHYGSGNSGGGFTLTTLSTTGEVLDVQTVSSLEGTGLEVGWNEGADGRDLGGNGSGSMLSGGRLTSGGGGCPEGDCGGNNPLRRYEDKVQHTLEEWVNRYEDKSLKEIATEGGWKQGQPMGPIDEWRFIQAPDGNVMDMRHVVVVGYIYGESIGNLIEEAQTLFDKSSAKDPQDYYSNKIGAYFNQLRHTGSWKSDSWAYDFGRFINTQYRTLFSNYKP